MTELSKVMGIDNSTLTGLIDRLERAGFVTRKASRTDRRIFHIYITPQGAAESAKAKPVISRVNQAIKTGLSRKHLELFKEILIGMVQKFNKPSC